MLMSVHDCLCVYLRSVSGVFLNRFSTSFPEVFLHRTQSPPIQAGHPSPATSSSPPPQQWAFGCAPWPAFYMCTGDPNSIHTLLAEPSLQAQHSSSLTQRFYFPVLCLRDRVENRPVEAAAIPSLLYPAGTRFVLADVATETHKNNFPHLTTYQHFLIPGLAHSSAAAREEEK